MSDDEKHSNTQSSVNSSDKRSKVSLPDKPERITNRLNRKIIAEDTRRGKFSIPIKNIKSGKRLFLVLIVVTLTILGSLGLYLFARTSNHQKSDENKVVFKIEGREYRQTDVFPYVAFLIAIGKKEPEAKKEVFDMFKYKVTATKLNYSPGDSLIKQAREDLTNTYSEQKHSTGYKDWLELASFVNASDNAFRLQQSNKSYKGYSYIFWFGQHISYTSDYTPPGGYGDKSLIEQDKNYAKQRADYYHKQLLEEKMTADQVLSEIKKDPKLCYQYTIDANLSTKYGYDPSTSWQDQIFYSSVVDYVSEHSSKPLGDIQTGKITTTTEAGATPTEQDAYYYFIKNEGNGVSKSQFFDTLNSLDAVFIG